MGGMTVNLDRVRRAARAHRRAATVFERTRAELVSALVEADDLGAKQVDLVEATGTARETIRRILIKARR
jgi:hypothetical protein